MSTARSNLRREEFWSRWWNLSVLWGCVMLLACATPAILVHAQDKNPFAGDPQAAKLGESQFRANCAFCHGLGAEGGGQTSHAHRSATAARTRKCFTTSTMESRARQCPQQRMEESASACRTEKSGK